MQEFASASSTLCSPCTPVQWMSTVPIVYSPSQRKVLSKRSGTSSIAAAAVTSLKTEPGGKLAERQRLMKAVSATGAYRPREG